MTQSAVGRVRAHPERLHRKLTIQAIVPRSIRRLGPSSHCTDRNDRSLRLRSLVPSLPV